MNYKINCENFESEMLYSSTMAVCRSQELWFKKWKKILAILNHTSIIIVDPFTVCNEGTTITFNAESQSLTKSTQTIISPRA